MTFPFGEERARHTILHSLLSVFTEDLELSQPRHFLGILEIRLNNRRVEL